MAEWPTESVANLEAVGLLRVEDGNHGEYRPRPEEFDPSGTAYIRAADVDGGQVQFATSARINRVALDRIRKGIGADLDVILTHKGTVGRVAQVPTGSPPFVCSPQTTFWRSLDHGRLDPRYLRAALESPDFVRQLTMHKSNTDMAPYVSLTQQRGMSLRLPPPGEQRAIAEVLGALDDKIAANTREEAVLDRLIAALYARALQESEARTEALLEAFDVDFGEPFGGEFFAPPGDGRPLIRIRDLKTFDSQVWTTEVRRRETVVRSGDVVVGMDAEFRATIWLGKPGLLNQRVCRVRSAVAGAALVREALRTPLAEIEGYKSATTVIHLNKEDLARSSVAIPSARALTAFEALAEPVLARRVALASERRSLAATRDALLPALMSGALRVRDAERVVEGAV